MVPPSSIRISRVPTYFLCVSSRQRFKYKAFTFFGSLSQVILLLCRASNSRALPISLATTFGISVDFFSCRYLDVSVPYVRLSLLNRMKSPINWRGSPIRISSGQRSFDNSPMLFAVYHVLLRLLLPRHSPYALNFLIL